MGGKSVWLEIGPIRSSLSERIREVAAWCPALSRGGLSWHQLVGLAHAWGRTTGVDVTVELRKRWPFGGSVQRFGERVVVFIDATLGNWDRRYVLAHEVSHLVLGHYDPRSDQPWFLTDGVGADEWEQEAQAFACLATRSPGLPLEWFVGK